MKTLVQYSGGEAWQKKLGLTPREQEIVAAAVAGYSDKGIADLFRISEDAVRHHLSNIFDKVGVSTRGELALFAVNMRESERERLARRDACERELERRGKKQKLG
jgi:DNA-binding NarL/FixJ family response regulator